MKINIDVGDVMTIAIVCIIVIAVLAIKFI